MVRAMSSFEEIIEEAKRRTVLFGLFILIAAYCMSLTSNSVLINIPVAIIVVALLRRLSLELDIRLRPPLAHTSRYQYQYKHTSFKEPPHSSSTSWKQKIDSPLIEAAADNLIQRLVKEWVTDLWYSSLTPDQEAPQEIRALINGVVGEIGLRAKQVNLISLLTSDVVNVVASHLELYREAQTSYGKERFSTLSSEERDEMIKQYLLSSHKLHPGVQCAEMEVQVLQRLMDRVLTLVLKTEDAQCKVLRCIARELLACAVMRPVLHFASPLFINQIVEALVVASRDENVAAEYRSSKSTSSHGIADAPIFNKSKSASGVELVGNAADASFEESNLTSSQRFESAETRSGLDHSSAGPSGDWAHALDAFNQRKTQALAPEHLDNLWAKGRNYRKKETAKPSLEKTAEFEPPDTINSIGEMSELRDLKRMQTGAEDMVLLEKTTTPVSVDSNYYGRPRESSRVVVVGEDSIGVHSGTSRTSVIHHPLELPETSENNESPRHQRSKSLEGLDKQHKASNHIERGKKRTAPNLITGYKSKLSCRVVGAHYEKLGSKSFAVYSISVSDAEGRTWVVLRRFRNFEQLHRRLRDMPHYTLTLPPKRFLSSNLDNSFVRERCILLNKYLQDLLSIPSIAELHEVWDFLSFKSQNYGFGESVSIIKTLAVNVDDAVDDVVRQIKGVSKKSNAPCVDVGGTASGWNFPANSLLSDGTNVSQPSDDDGEDEYHSGWHSDSEVHKMDDSRLRKSVSGCFSDGQSPVDSIGYEGNDDEWSPPRLTIPLLNLVDVVFELEGRGWIRRQVLWIAKQVLQLGMGDAIDDWLLSRIQHLRRDDVIASGIKWIEQILWPDGVFVTKHHPPSTGQLSFEEQLEAARRAMVVRELIQERAPTTLVGLIGRRQYQRCAKDIYGFLQSSVCIKQLAFSLLEKLLAATFPELEDFISELRL